jgi:uncharacterized protein with ATP-grasp and redox domains
MKTNPECFECLFRQASKVVNGTDSSREIQTQTLKRILHALEKADSSLSPSEIAGDTNQILRESLGIKDIYKEEKIASHARAFGYINQLRTLIREGSDLLEQGVKISASGNVIDIIHTSDYDLWQEVENTVASDLQGGDLEIFRQILEKVPHILYLADNVGETIFDRVFIETLDIPVIYAVKSGPILNDALLEDALAAEIDEVAEIVETGSQSPGTILSQCSPEFQELFNQSELVISKGQANYETLDEQGDKVFFLLRVKCSVLGRSLDAPLGSLVLKQGLSSA